MPVFIFFSSLYSYASVATGHMSLVLLDKLQNGSTFELAASFTRPPNPNKFVYVSLPLNGSSGNVIFQIDTSFPAIRKGRWWYVVPERGL